eukprot:TRINITY_DN9090_c0_g1_i6.p1 TRINITY_DN9090_c0_g1~~TRINITY_DN9090_c0_g1_i6.p1  ORF type:complete len:135 (-),score=1.23 TRINITY_DN9090_c0_g1_i6:318-722(-)
MPSSGSLSVIPHVCGTRSSTNLLSEGSEGLSSLSLGTCHTAVKTAGFRASHSRTSMSPSSSTDTVDGNGYGCTPEAYAREEFASIGRMQELDDNPRNLSARSRWTSLASWKTRAQHVRNMFHFVGRKGAVSTKN